MSPCSAQDLPSFPHCSPMETSPVPIGLTSPHNCWPTLLCDCITPSRDLLMTFVGLWAKLASRQKNIWFTVLEGFLPWEGGRPNCRKEMFRGWQTGSREHQEMVLFKLRPTLFGLAS